MIVYIILGSIILFLYFFERAIVYELTKHRLGDIGRQDFWAYMIFGLLILPLSFTWNLSRDVGRFIKFKYDKKLENENELQNWLNK